MDQLRLQFLKPPPERVAEAGAAGAAAAAAGRQVAPVPDSDLRCDASCRHVLHDRCEKGIYIVTERFPALPMFSTEGVGN